MSLGGTDRALQLFQTRNFDRAAIPTSRFSEPSKPVKIPGFVVRQESALRGCLASVKALCARPKLPYLNDSKYIFRDARLTGLGPPAVGIADSLLLHCALILAIIFVPMALPTTAPNLSSAFLPPEVIFYPVPEHRTASRLPRIAPRGRGGRPGSGTRPDVPPNFGRTVSNGKLTVISKPLHPDNLHQTIIQPSSPPDLRIPNDLQVPNLSLGTLAAPKKPIFDLSIKKPTRENAKLASDMATPLAESNADHSLATDLQPTNSQPKLPIPTSPIAKPVRKVGLEAEMATPLAETNADYSLATSLQSSNSQPKLPIPTSPIAKPVRKVGLEAEMATPLAETNADYSLATSLQSSNSQPKLPIPTSPIAKPIRRGAGVEAEMATPLAESKADYSLANSLHSTNSQPKIPISAGPIAKPSRRDAGVDGGTGTGSEAPQIGTAGNGRAILAIGINPSGPNPALAIPPGSRWGEFSIAPGTGDSGSAGGRPGGVAGGGGSAGNGRAGDESVGIGPGREGGGGGKNGLPSSISIVGTGTSAGGVAALDPRIEAGIVFPVPGSFGANLRKNRMIVSAGPMGGGGLNIYGALSCGKIYTIFLPMNGASWTMQYCQKSSSAEAPKPDRRSNVIQLEPGLVPPDPNMESRYDFKRASVPAGKAGKLIVLKGTLQEDGSIEGLEVYQGIVPPMDEAARLAFSRWKFKPAMRAGKPVALEILVGIPPESDAAGESR